MDVYYMMTIFLVIAIDERGYGVVYIRYIDWREGEWCDTH